MQQILSFSRQNLMHNWYQEDQFEPLQFKATKFHPDQLRIGRKSKKKFWLHEVSSPFFTTCGESFNGLRFQTCFKIIFLQAFSG